MPLSLLSAWIEEDLSSQVWLSFVKTNSQAITNNDFFSLLLLDF